MTELVTLERADGIACVTLNRPAAMNALSTALRAQLAVALAAADADESVRAIILTGAGERAFTAGLDLRELESDPSALADANASDPAANPAAAVENCRKPVIGAINGMAITGGFELALACDILIASTTARFADTHSRVGVMPGWGLSQKLSRVIGPYRAKELSLTGNFIDARTACAWGLVSRIVEPTELIPAARRLAADIGSADPALIAELKALIDDGWALPYSHALALEHRISCAWNKRQTLEDIKARRGALMARGRAQ